jgi:hypothetical protein
LSVARADSAPRRWRIVGAKKLFFRAREFLRVARGESVARPRDHATAARVVRGAFESNAVSRSAGGGVVAKCRAIPARQSRAALGADDRGARHKKTLKIKPIFRAISRRHDRRSAP